MKKLLNPTSVHWSKVALNHQFTYFTKLKNGKSEYKFKEYERIQMTFSAFQDKRYELSSIFYQQVLIYFQCGNWNYYLWSYLMDSALHCDDTLFFKKKSEMTLCCSYWSLKCWSLCNHPHLYRPSPDMLKFI